MTSRRSNVVAGYAGSVKVTIYVPKSIGHFGTETAFTVSDRAGETTGACRGSDHSVGIFDHESRTIEERLGPLLLSEISDVTGGWCYTLDNPNDLPLITERIGAELRNQYVLGYRPTANDDGKWLKIKVNLTYLPKGLSPLRIRAKSGYYAPSR